jgi:hypothetical protein
MLVMIESELNSSLTQGRRVKLYEILRLTLCHRSVRQDKNGSVYLLYYYNLLMKY